MLTRPQALLSFSFVTSEILGNFSAISILKLLSTPLLDLITVTVSYMVYQAKLSPSFSEYIMQAPVRLPVRQRITFTLLLISFKTLHQPAPSYQSNLITATQFGRYNLCSTNTGICLSYLRFKSKKTLADRSFMLAAPMLCNHLSADISSSSTVQIFKAKLETCLF